MSLRLGRAILDLPSCRHFILFLAFNRRPPVLRTRDQFLAFHEVQPTHQQKRQGPPDGMIDNVGSLYIEGFGLPITSLTVEKRCLPTESSRISLARFKLICSSAPSLWTRSCEAQYMLAIAARPPLATVGTIPETAFLRFFWVIKPGLLRSSGGGNGEPAASTISPTSTSR